MEINIQRDGTCERDYIHIEDLSSAHLKILSELEDLKSTEIFTSDLVKELLYWS